MTDDDAFEFDLRVSQKWASLEIPQTKWLDPAHGPSNIPWAAMDPAADIHVQATQVLDYIHAAGPDGLTRAQISQMTGYSPEVLAAVFASLAADKPPDVFWAGYDVSRLISVGHWDQWTHVVKTTGEREAVKEIRVKPRRWVDIFGQVIKDDWESCLKSTMGHITLKPGTAEVSSGSS